MSRSGYSDECENLALYRGTVTRAIRGKRGQAFFRDLRAALDALPEKRLVYGTLRDEATGSVCALGAVGVLRGVTLPEVNDEDCGESIHPLGKLFNIAPCLAAEVQYMNDEAAYRSETDEERYARVSEWVNESIKRESPAIPTEDENNGR